jgi:hypothetical protein
MRCLDAVKGLENCRTEARLSPKEARSKNEDPIDGFSNEMFFLFSLIWVKRGIWRQYAAT